MFKLKKKEERKSQTTHPSFVWPATICMTFILIWDKNISRTILNGEMNIPVGVKWCTDEVVHEGLQP